MKTLFLIFTFLSVISLQSGLAGCSNKSASQVQIPTPSSSHAFNGGAFAGFHANATKTTSSHRLSVLPPVYAQTTSTITLTGAYTGYSPLFVGALSQGQGVQIPEGSVPIAYPVYGIGTLSPACINQSNPNTGVTCLYGVGAGSVSAGQALASQVNATTALQGSLSPAFVAGDGKIGPMVAFGYALNGTIQPGSPTTSILVEVWVIRNGQVLGTGISCPLNVQANGAAVQIQRCESSSTFDVLDRDGLVTTVTLNPADELAAVNFYLVKN